SAPLGVETLGGTASGGCLGTIVEKKERVPFPGAPSPSSARRRSASPGSFTRGRIMERMGANGPGLPSRAELGLGAPGEGSPGSRLRDRQSVPSAVGFRGTGRSRSLQRGLHVKQAAGITKEVHN